MSVDPRPLLATSSEALLDCLVVGAGPVGLLLASELAARGCKVVIIDALLEPAKQTKASAVVPRSLEVLPAEVEGKLLLNGNLLKSMQVREKKEGDALKTVLDIKTSSLEVYGGILGIRQQETEKYLTEYLTTLPDWFRGGKKTMEIQRGVLLESFTEGPTGVQCVLKTVNSGGLETVSCKFLVGCDGGRSNVRKHLGFSFEGTTTPEYFFGLDACFQNFEMDAKDVVSVSLTQDQDPLAPGFAFNIPFGDGNCLLLVDVDLQQQKEWVTGELDRNGLPVLRQPEVEDVLKVARSRGLGANLSVKPGSVRWLTHFRVNSRQVECYGRGRIFLAGDACHCHSPLGGQGMNMGFQDAKNLAWKLALAIKCGGPTSSLLLSYESERKTMENKLLGGIERAQEVISSRNPVIFFMRGRGQRLVNMLTFLQPAALSLLAQQAWSYRKSLISMEHWERPTPTCFPITSICPAGGYRRRQNLHRWLATRIHAGDRVPDVLLPGGGHLHHVLKKSRGFTLLLFEGSDSENLDMEKHLHNKVLSFKEMQAFGISLKCPADQCNFVAMIDEVVCFPSQDLEADLTSVAKAARKEWQELAEIRGSEQLPPPEGGNVTTLLTQLFRLESQVREKFQSAVPSASSSSKSMPKSKTDPIAKEVAALEKQRSEMQAQIQQLRQEAEQLKAEASSTRRQQMKELEEIQQEVQKKKLELQDLERQRSEQMKAQELKSQPPSKGKQEMQFELEKSQAELQELRKAQLEFEKSKAELQELREAQLEFEKSKAELQELRNAQLEFEKSKAELQELREIKLDFEKSQAEMQELSKTKLKLEKSQAELQALKAQQADQQPRIRSREDTVGSIDHAEVESIICRKASPEVEDPSQLSSKKSIQAQAPSSEAQVEADTAMDKVKMKSRPVKLKEATSLAPEPCHKSTQVSIDLPAVPVVSKQRPDAQGELRGENQQLRLEVSRLQKVLVELQQQLHQLAANPESRGDVLKQDFPWKNTAFHLSKVHERLYLDAYERQERQRALQQSIQQAREFEVLDIFRSQHPWLNPLRDAHDISETFAWSICSAHWSSVEGAEEATCQAQDKASQKPCQRPFSSRLVPSPRSPEPSDSLEVEAGLPSPQGEILPLVVCSLGGDETKPVATRPRSSTPTLLGRSETMQSKARRGLPLSGTEATVTRPLRPASAASGLGSRKLQEGLRLLASKPGEAMRDAKTTLTRPKSVGSIRHLH